MGIETLILGISAVASTAFGVVGAVQANRAAQEQEDANKVSKARDENRRREQLRQRVREERIRRAQILNSAENTGTSSSSGAIGAVGALSSSLGGVFSFSRAEKRAADSISRKTQNAANFNNSAQLAGSLSDLSASIGKGFSTIFDEINDPVNAYP